MADHMIEEFPEILEHSRGSDPIYESWYREILMQYPTGVLTMEERQAARMNGRRITPPYPDG